MSTDAAETARLQPLLTRLGAGLDEFVRFEHPDALHPGARWREALDRPLPQAGISADAVLDELLQQVVPNGSAVPPERRGGMTSARPTVDAILRDNVSVPVGSSDAPAVRRCSMRRPMVNHTASAASRRRRCSVADCFLEKWPSSTLIVCST